MTRRAATLCLFALGGLLVACLGPMFAMEIPFALVAGWARFLMRVGPSITVDPGGLAMAGVCLALLAALTHSFFGWLSWQVGGLGGSGWKRKWTASMVAIVVLMFTAGISATGIAHQSGWLLTSKEPWLSGSMTAVRRMQSTSNLRQIGRALAEYESVEGTFPAAASLDNEGRLLHGWQARVLPYLEQSALHDQINFAVPWDDPRNDQAMRTRVHQYLNPGVEDDAEATGPAPSHYSGNVLVLGGDRVRKVADIRDGSAVTILAGEASGEFKPWGHPANWRDPARGINRSPDGFGGPSKGGASFLFADGSVHFIKETVDPKVLRSLCDPDDSGPAQAPD